MWVTRFVCGHQVGRTLENGMKTVWSDVEAVLSELAFQEALL